MLLAKTNHFGFAVFLIGAANPIFFRSSIRDPAEHEEIVIRFRRRR